MIAGVRRRFASKPPDARPGLLLELRKFVREWCRENLTPLSNCSDTSVETWLESTHYPRWRKDQLLNTWKDINGHLDHRHYKCKGFMKDETYTKYKHARGINSRMDAFKCLVGPIFKLIEKEVFKRKEFIKNVPVAERPNVIASEVFMSGEGAYATDYEAFESLFTKDLMEACEFELYDYMTSHLNEGSEFMRTCRKVLGGKNEIQYKHFIVKLMATRMSGEMCTSLGNSFANLMCLLFSARRNGNTNVRPKIEGDDCIATMNGKSLTSKIFEELGLKIKIDKHDNPATASFCGMVFDLEDKINVTDPRDVLAGFGWTTVQYARSKSVKLKVLLRCKALSYAHQYPGCPIISSLAHYGLKVTRSIDIRHHVYNSGNISMWDREQLIEALRDEKSIQKRPAGLRTRFLVESLYGVSRRSQELLEEMLDFKTDLSPLDCSMIYNFHPDWENYYYTYGRSVDPGSSMLCFPLIWYPRSDFVREW